MHVFEKNLKIIIFFNCLWTIEPIRDIVYADQYRKDLGIMTIEEKVTALEHLLRKCPDVLSVIGAAKWTHMSKNTIYALIKSGQLSAYPYRGAFLVSKSDLIEYLAETSDEEPNWKNKFKGRTHREK